MLPRPDSMYTFTDPRLQKKHPWRAAAETFGMNVGVWAFDRYVMNEDFAKISIGSIRRNIKHGFVWDNDQFSTNLFAHPYHGNLYFNAARSNGLTFWESAPYAFAGSLMWEIAAEVEPPAINDLMATTLGGIALGEVTHRMSSLVLDDSKRGFSRFTREFLGTLICPMRGLNRMITGEMWKVKRSHYKYHDYDRIPVHFSIGAGDRYLADDNYLFRGEHNPYLEFRVQYGDAFDKVNDGPYDYFTARATFGLSGNQPLISQINLMGKLWGVPLKTTTGMEMMFGIFQHFNYFDSEEVIDGSGRIPYKISEAASVGPGMIYKFPRMNSLVNLEQRVFLSAILLGGSLTDYYNVIDRNYNMGSGYSIKNNTIQYGKRIQHKEQHHSGLRQLRQVRTEYASLPDFYLERIRTQGFGNNRSALSECAGRQRKCNARCSESDYRAESKLPLQSQYGSVLLLPPHTLFLP